MVETYLSRRLEDADALSQSLQANSVEKFNQVGHQLLGNARSYGFLGLEPIATRMEQLSGGDLKHIGPQLLGDFNKWLAKARSDFSAKRSREI